MFPNFNPCNRFSQAPDVVGSSIERHRVKNVSLRIRSILPLLVFGAAHWGPKWISGP